ncbi:exodeoxyribonuclease V beta chain [Vibrio astriarenae]|nr:exodeoxyribonuclease V beta chain [Vibrio sp. C7]
MTNAAQDVTPLNAMTFPLHGARLIEASAGTGKTFTIAGLYLRLILGTVMSRPVISSR